MTFKPYKTISQISWSELLFIIIIIIIIIIL